MLLPSLLPHQRPLGLLVREAAFELTAVCSLHREGCQIQKDGQI